MMKKIIAALGVTVLLAGCASKNFEIFDNKKEEGTVHGFLTGAATGAIVSSPTLVGAGAIS